MIHPVSYAAAADIHVGRIYRYFEELI